MKAGVASLIIGIVGLLIVTYFYYQTMQALDRLGELQHIVTPYAMNNTTRIALLILETVGAVTGFVAYRKWKARVGLLGLGICTLNLILLFYPF